MDTDLVYAVQRGSTSQLYVRDLESFDATPIPGTEGGTTPFFSPDGRWVGFVADGIELRKVLLGEGGGAPLTIARLPDPGVVAHGSFVWGANDTIIVGWLNGAPFRVSANGGGELVALGRSDGLITMGAFPQFLPGEQTVLLTTLRGIELLELDTGERTVLVESEADGAFPVFVSPRYAPTGHLIYGQRGSLMAVPFDVDRRAVTGTPIPVLSGVYASGRINGHYYTFSSTGTLVYVAGRSGNRLAWVDRDGTTMPVESTEGTYRWPRISPDGSQVVVTIASHATGVTSVWVGGTSLERLRPLTRELSVTGVWEPDGSAVVLWHPLAQPSGIYRQDVGTSSTALLHETGFAVMPRSWTPEGALLVEREGDIWALTEDGAESAIVRTDADEVAPAVSPNGRWLAYVSNESGQPEVWMKPWGGTGTPIPVSDDGGTEPAWSRDGRELFYRSGEQMLSVALSEDGSLGQPEVLFERRFATDLGEVANYDVGPDGRFLMILTDEDSTTTQINIVEDWFEELTRLVPTGQ